MEGAVNQHHDSHANTYFGFWVYIMTDCVLFGTLFIAYATLHDATYEGPTSQDLFHLPFVLTETLLLLASSFTCGLAMLSLKSKAKLIFWYAVTFLLGAAFLAMELHEFRHLVQEGNSWARSAFLTSFFTLVATHGLHITTGLLWMIILLIPVWRHGMTPASEKRLSCLQLFWHFLDVVWIFIFSLVYLMGAK